MGSVAKRTGHAQTHMERVCYAYSDFRHNLEKHNLEKKCAKCYQIQRHRLRIWGSIDEPR